MSDRSQCRFPRPARPFEPAAERLRWPALAVGCSARQHAPQPGPRTGTGPPFAGDTYLLVDVGGNAGQRLPSGNLVSLVVAAERMAGPADAAEVLGGALRLLAAAEREAPRETFLGSFRQLVAHAGMDFEFAEDRANMQPMGQSGVLCTTLGERFQAMHDAFRAESETRGLERERQRLVRLAGRKCGTDVAEPVAPQLAGIDKPDRLQDVGEWIVNCEIGSEGLAWLQETEQPGLPPRSSG